MAGIEWEYNTMNQLIPMTTVDMVNQIVQQMPDSNFVVSIFATDKEDNILPTKENLFQ